MIDTFDIDVQFSHVTAISSNHLDYTDLGRLDFKMLFYK